MDPSAAKLIGAGLPRSRLSAPASASAPSSATTCKAPCATRRRRPSQFANLLLGFALAEATGLFGLVVALIILFVF